MQIIQEKLKIIVQEAAENTAAAETMVDLRQRIDALVEKLRKNIEVAKRELVHERKKAQGTQAYRKTAGLGGK